MKTRKNVYELNDDTLLWYSKAIAHMKTLDINDPRSWWYQGGIHGYAESGAALGFWQHATGFPPSNSTKNSGYWNRCQHATWYFLPWHRMYLYYFEKIVAKFVAELGGPQNWALPYWNYCNYYNPDISQQESNQALNLPPEFGSSNGPLGVYSDLWIAGRINYSLRPRNVDPTRCMNEISFTNQQGDINFGGGVTGFSHFGNQTGQLESLPHNVVHVNIDGAMGDPDTAALDPIFWLHHANIDRLWQVWLDQPGRRNPTTNSWNNFSFKFHDENGNPVSLFVRDTNTTQNLDYEYTPNYPLQHIQVAVPEATTESDPLDVVGASDTNLDVNASGISVNLNLVPKPARNSNLVAVTDEKLKKPKRSILKVSNIKGQGKTSPLDLFINSKKPGEDDENHFIGSIGLFGLEQTSKESLEHDGGGLNFALDVSDIVEKLRSQKGWDEDNISIQVVPQKKNTEKLDVSIGRISLHSSIDV